MDGTLLPINSDIYERAQERALMPRWTGLEAAVDALPRAKLIAPPPSFLPWLVLEYGLGELTPYVPNLYNLLSEGIAWQRIRGTPAAVAKGLGWIGYSATIEPAWPGRQWWNSFQLRFPNLPASDAPDLERVEGITALSVPKRSQLRRGVHAYDVGALEADGSRLDGSHLEQESGIRLAAGGTVWSFGRTTEIDHTLTEAEGSALGNWIEPPISGDLPWAEMTYPWVTAKFKWADSPAAVRRSLMAAWFPAQAIYLRLSDAAGDVIGYRRARACHAVNPAFGGAYQVGSEAFAPAAGGRQVYVEAMTDFADAADIEARSVALVANVTLRAGIPAGRLWLDADDVTAATAFAPTAVSIPLRTTVRECFKFIVRF